MDFGGFMIHKAVKKTLLIVLAAGLVVVVLLWGAIEYTSRPSFCTSCHYMEPYYQAWQTSTHREVTCTDCHFLPGVENKIKGKFTAISMVANYMTGIYRRSKPWAEIENASCLRAGCHVVESLYGTIPFKEKVKFDHEPHLSKPCRGKQLRCTSCHAQIIQGEHISVSSSTCFLCHFKSSKVTAPINRCTQCHDAPVPTENRPTVKYDHTLVKEKEIECQKCHGTMQVGDGAVPKEHCSSCHAEAEKIERYGDVNLIHKYHVTDHKVECQNCHLMIQHKSITRTADIKPDCNNCHEAEHVEQLTLFLGTSNHSDLRVPNPMFNAGLNCKACHIFHKYEGGVSGLSQSTVANGASCEKCHGKGYAKLFDRWEEIMQQKVDAIGEQIQVARKILSQATASPEALRAADKYFEKAVFNYQLVKRGNIVHNIVFSDQLLVEASQDLDSSLATLGIDTTFPQISLYSEMVPPQCKNCHYGQEEITVEAFGIQFPHSIHIVEQRLPCSKCHSNYQQHGETIISKSECLQCHHTQESVACEDCHTLQAQVYQGTVAFASEPMPDVMALEEVECRSCHGGEESEVRRARGSDCIECHDEDYGVQLADWQRSTKQTLALLNQILSSDTTGAWYGKNKAVVDRVRTGIAQIQADRSLGAHNNELITETLQEYNEIIQGIVE